MRCNVLLAVAVLIFSSSGCSDPRLASDPKTELDGPPQRIVTLAPHLAELVVSAGAQAQLVGVSAYTDFPAQLQSLPVVGDGFRIDAEALLAVAPDLVLVWDGGGQQASVELLERLGIKAQLLPGRTLADIATTLRRIGVLTNNVATAERAASAFEARIGNLSASGVPLKVFYQIGDGPLYTVNGQHFISELIAACGGHNIFAELPALAPVVSVEAVVQRNPDVILHAGRDDQPSLWRRWPSLTVNQANNWLSIPGDLVARPSLRVADGGVAVCNALRDARGRISTGQPDAL